MAAAFVAPLDAAAFVTAPTVVSAPAVAPAALLRGSAGAQESRGFGSSLSSAAAAAAASVAAGAVLGSKSQRRTRCRAAKDDAPEAQPSCGVCGSNAPMRGRRAAGMTLAGFLGAAATTTEAANAEQKGGYASKLQLQFTECQACAGEGINNCINCKGTGQFRLLGQKPGEAQMQYQFVDCPDCFGVGQRVCERCFGTGLPTQQLRGFMRKPEFAVVTRALQEQRVTVYNIKDLQAEVRKAMNLQNKPFKEPEPQGTEEKIQVVAKAEAPTKDA